MKRLIALMMCAVSLGAAAQISFDAPWNPDANGDAQIGVSDLQSFLAVYGQDFGLGTFITPDSTHMLINRGIADYTRCLGLCRFANGAARVATRRDLGIHSNELNVEMTGSTIWISSIDGGETEGGPNFVSTNKNDNYYLNFGATVDRNTPNTDDDPRLCFCAVEELRKKEYYVWGTNETNGTIESINESFNSFAQEGWIWLGQIEPGKNLFWRWAE